MSRLVLPFCLIGLLNSAASIEAFQFRLRPKPAPPDITLTPIATVEMHKHYGRHLAVSPDGRWLAVTGDWQRGKRFGEDVVYETTLFETTTWQPVDRLVHRPGAHCAAFSPDSQWLIVTNIQQQMELYRLNVEPRTRRKFWKFVDAVNNPELPDEIRVKLKPDGWIAGHQPTLPVAFTPDGAKVVTSADAWNGELFPRRANVWEFSAGSFTFVRSLRLADEHRLLQLQLSPDGQALATADPMGDFSVWDPGTGEKRFASNLKDVIPEFANRRNPALHLALTWLPDSRAIVVQTDRGVTLIDSASGKLIRHHSDARSNVGWHNQLKTHPAGHWLLQPGEFRSLPDFDLSFTTNINLPHGDHGPFAFTADGRHLITASADLQVYDVQQILKQAQDFFQGQENTPE